VSRALVRGWDPHATRLSVLGLLTGLLLGLAAVSQPMLALGLAFGLVFVVVTFRSLAAGVALFTVLVSLEGAPGLDAGIALAKPAGAVLAVAWAAELIGRRGDNQLLYREHPVVAFAAIGFAIWALASSLWAVDAGVSLSSSNRLAQGALLLFVVFSAIRTLADVRLVLGAYVVGALVAMLVGIATSGTDQQRLSGGGGNPNELAAVLVPAIVICGFALLAERRPFARWALVAIGLTLLLGLFLTGSREGLVGMTVALALAIVLAGRSRMPIVAVTLVVLGASVVYYASLAPPDQKDRLLSARSDRGTGREDIWKVAEQVVRDKPLHGAGAGNFPIVAPTYAARDINIARVDFVVDDPKVVHNTYLEVLAELGLVGAALFAVVVGGALRTAFNAIRRARSLPWDVQLLVRGFAVSLAGILSAYFFGSREYEKQLWLLLGIAFALAYVVDRQAVASATSGADEISNRALPRTVPGQASAS
jgi:O-antigen ligase